MLDLETLGTGHNAAIISIGATRFNLEDVETFDQIMADKERLFFAKIYLKDLQGDINGETVEWWLQQSEEARREVVTSPDHVATHVALSLFDSFMFKSEVDVDKRTVWGNGSVFDNVILSSAYKRSSELQRPWTYRGDRDVRTIVAVTKQLYPDLDLSMYRRSGIAHRAVDDAVNQVLMVQHCYRRLHGSA